VTKLAEVNRILRNTPPTIRELLRRIEGSTARCHKGPRGYVLSVDCLRTRRSTSVVRTNAHVL
jgi:hypothetical protein